MSEHDFGVYSLLYSFIPIVMTVGSLGLDHVLRRFQPEYLRNGQSYLALWLLRLVCKIRLVANLCIIIAILLAWNWLSPWFDLQAYRINFAVFGMLILFFFQINLLQFSLASHMLHRYSVGSVAIINGGKLITYLLLSHLDALTLTNAIFSDVVSHGLAFAFLLVVQWHLHKSQRMTLVEKPAAQEVKRLRRYATFMHFNDSASLLTYTETDRFFIAALMSPIAVGAYAFYTRLNEMISNLVPLKLFDNVVQPLFFGVPTEEAKEKIPRYFTLLMNLNLVYQLPAIVFTSVYHREIVSVVFGGRFIEHSVLLPIIVAFGASDNVLSIPVTIVAQYKERASVILASQAVGLYQIFAMLTLIPVFGLVGAAVATGTFHLFRNLYVWWQVRDVAVWRNFQGVLVSGTIVWGGCGIACFLLRDALAIPGFMTLVLGIAVCAIGTLLYIRSPALNESDRQILARILHGKESRALRFLGLLPAANNSASGM